MNFQYQLVFLLKRIYWFLFRPRTYGVKCVLVDNGKIIMVRRSFGSDKWVFPGGVIKVGESPNNAVRREIKEDLGIVLEELHDLGDFTQSIYHRRETIRCFTSVGPFNTVGPDKEKIKEIRWFEVAHLPSLTPVSTSVMSLYKAR